MGTAEDLPIGLQTMPNDPAAAMLAARRKRMNGALETVKRVPPAGHDHVKALVIFIATHFTLCHMKLLKKIIPLLR